MFRSSCPFRCPGEHITCEERWKCSWLEGKIHCLPANFCVNFTFTHICSSCMAWEKVPLTYEYSFCFSFLYLLIDLGLEGDHQLLNASLALQLCQTWFLRRCEKDNTPEGLIFISLNRFNLWSVFQKSQLNFKKAAKIVRNMVLLLCDRNIF